MIGPEPLMGPNKRVSICLKARRSVIQRWATARRVIRPIDITPEKTTESSGPIIRPFGSLALPKAGAALDGKSLLTLRRLRRYSLSLGRLPAGHSLAVYERALTRFRRERK